MLCTRFIRESVEADLVRRAARRATPAQIQALFAQVTAQEQASDSALLARLDEDFHASIAAIAGKAMVWTHLQQVKIHLDRARHLLTALMARDTIIAQHRAVVEALASGEPDRAEAAIRLHLRRVLRDLPALLDLSPDYFTKTALLTEYLEAEG